MKFDVQNRLCSEKECEPPYGGKENCEFCDKDICVAPDRSAINTYLIS